jgi:hypothetical protein
MSTSSPPQSSRDRMRAHRVRLRAQGLRRIEMWVPDVRTPEFKAEAHRQSLLTASSAMEPEDQAFIDAISDWPSDGMERPGDEPE